MEAEKVVAFVRANHGGKVGFDTPEYAVNGTAIGYNDRGVWVAGSKGEQRGEFLVPYADITHTRQPRG